MEKGSMRKRDLVKWEVPEPFTEPRQNSIKICKVRPKETVRGLVLSDQVIGCKTHWMNGRTKPCIGIEKGCEGCLLGMPWRWKGWLAVYLPNLKTPWLLEVSQNAYDNNLELAATEGLRGRDFKASRPGDHVNSKLYIELLPSLTKPENVPPAFDVMAVLERIWFGERPGRRNGKKGGEDE
jgi:hypothetical protein